MNVQSGGNLSSTNRPAKKAIFLDYAATTPCAREVSELMAKYSCEDYGNASSSHQCGQTASHAIRKVRSFFATQFLVQPEQVVFTGSGTEADNLAVQGIALQALAKSKQAGTPVPRVLFSALEHPAVKNTALSLKDFGIEVEKIPVDKSGSLDKTEFERLMTPQTCLVSIMQVNNITGITFPVEDLATLVKNKVPHAIFHTDAIQAFGKVKHPTSNSKIDLVSLSGHKINGPKGVGALILLNSSLLKEGLRPLVWGGSQEQGLRSGTSNTAGIVGFGWAAENALKKADELNLHCIKLKTRLKEVLSEQGLLSIDASHKSKIHWNSPDTAVPYIVSLSVPGVPSSALAMIIEEKGYQISTGSACSSKKQTPEAALLELGYSTTIAESALRVSFSSETTLGDIDGFGIALKSGLEMVHQLLGRKP